MIDFHCHLDLYPDPQSIARECVSRGLYVLSVTNTPSAWEGTRALQQDAPRLRTGLGLHPQLVESRRHEVSLFEKLISETNYVGEIGLDGGPKYKSSWINQQHVFRKILRVCSKAGGRVLSIHSKQAADAVLKELKAYPDAGTPVLHWFSGSERALEKAVDQGCWFSVGPTMLSGARGRRLLARMPPDRVLTETDGPFTQVERRALLPWEVSRALPILSELWELTADEVDRRLSSNLRRLVAAGQAV